MRCSSSSMRSTRSTPARLRPSSVVSRWISAQPLDVRVRVEARVAGGALRADEALLLVDAQRLRMHADELGGDADHVARTVVHQPPAFCSCSSSSRCFLSTRFGTSIRIAREHVALAGALQPSARRGP